MQFATLQSVGFNGTTVNYTGNVHELTYTTTRYVSQYIPVQRFENTAGPPVPNPNGNITGLSKTTFSYQFDRGFLSTLGVTLDSPATWAGAEAGF